MKLPTIGSNPSIWLEVAVWAGVILGNYFYSQLWLAEGRDRERADQGKARAP